MKKIKIYKKGMGDALKPFKEKLEEQSAILKKTREDLNDRFDDVIDCIEFNNSGLDPKELIKLLKNKKVQQLREFNISLIYDSKEDQDFVELLRKDLNSQKHSCKVIKYSEFKKHGDKLADYRIYIGNPEKVNEEKVENFYKAYGMLISRCEDGFIVEYNGNYKFTDEERKRFISYYEIVVKNSLERGKQVEKALKKRKEKHTPASDSFIVDNGINFFDKLLSSWDFWDNKPIIPTLLLGFPHVLLTFAVSLIGLVGMIPLGIGEILLRSTLEGLQTADFDRKFTANAQRQILEIRVTDYFKQEQIKKIMN